MTNQNSGKVYVDELCVVSFFTGELGWLIQKWQGYLRHLKHTDYPNHKFILMMNKQFHPLVHDFVTYTIDLPQDFYNLNLETDCFESPHTNSPPGSLTPPNVYAALIKYIRGFYNPTKAIEVWTPRGCDKDIDNYPQVFCKYSSDKDEEKSPIITVMPRSRDRASNRNVPEFVWREFVENINPKITVVIAGTKDGACLSGFKKDNVINLVDYEGDDKFEKFIHYVSHSVLTVSSQSGTTHISLLCGTPTYIIGHENKRHTVDSNRFLVPSSFRLVTDYRAIDAETILKDVDGFLNVLVNKKMLTSDLKRIVDFSNNLFRPSIRTLTTKKDLIGAEIGVWRGDHTLNMLNNLDIKKLYLIDSYKMLDTHKEVAHERLKEFGDKIVWIEDKSNSAVNEIKDNELDFVYIDSNCAYECVKEDIELYYPKIKENGLIAGHEYNSNIKNNEVIRAVNEFFTKLKINIQSDVSSDDRKTNDWWCIKPITHDKIIEDSIKTLNKLSL